MRRPTLQVAVEINRAVRTAEEWFDDPDDLARIGRALASIATVQDPVEAAGILAYRIARAQGFAEGNKRTGLLLARWLLDQNGLDGPLLLPPDDVQIADLLVKAAADIEVEQKIVDLPRLLAGRPRS